jgi:hypothetical protein
MALPKKLLREKRQKCESVRMENAAKRNKTLPRVYRRAITAAAAAAEAKDEAIPNSSIRTNITGISLIDGLGDLHEVDGETRAGMETERVDASPAASKSTPTGPRLKYHHEMNATMAQRQAKSCTGPKAFIDEGVSLASDDGDFARIHAANRKAWPRGQEPIAADATIEDREIAELLRRGVIGAQELRVDHDEVDGHVCPYTVRFVAARKKGRKGNNDRRQGGEVAEPPLLHPEPASDWWYLDDEVYAQLLSDGGAEFVDWSETSSFVHVD